MIRCLLKLGDMRRGFRSTKSSLLLNVFGISMNMVQEEYKTGT